MKINFENEVIGISDGLNEILKNINHSILDNIEINFTQSSKGLNIIYKDRIATICCESKNQFFRSVGLLTERLNEKGIDKNIKICQTQYFDDIGVMFDVSRNGVLTVESIKKFLVKLALMGHNMVLMYMEDVYTIDELPYFGYMRGRYSKEELIEIDEYANMLGIEVIPCIQTLGHLKNALKWGYAKDIKDTESVLLVGEEKTYDFINLMIKNLKECFSTNRIHIGLDEAFGLGQGQYMHKNGYTPRYKLMMDHLKRVVEIVKNNNLFPFMWGDMFFRVSSDNEEYLDPDIVLKEEVLDNIPKGIDFVFWDYGDIDIKLYERYIDMHNELGAKLYFAGGVAMWNGPCTNYYRTINTSNAALKACKNKGVKSVFACLWANDGNENNHFTSLMGLQLFAEHCYNDSIDINQFKKRVSFCTELDYDSYMNFSDMDVTEDFDFTGLERSNPTKYTLWQDVLMGLFDNNINSLNLEQHFVEMKKKLKETKINKNSIKWDEIIDYYICMCDALRLKSKISIDLIECYKNGHKNKLKLLTEKSLPDLYNKINTLRISHRKLWHSTYKPFGWEILDIRYGGVLSRIDSAIYRINEYLVGNLKKIEELEEERLWFYEPVEKDGRKAIFRNIYTEMISASDI